MAGVLHKLLRKTSAVRIIISFNNSQQSNIVAPLVLHQPPHLSDCKPDDSIGFGQSPSEEAEEMVSGNSQTVWADSVKKKRKRKMNKHKYKKLRKRLQRQS